MTNNNRVDLAGEGLDCAIRFGDGAWHGTEATRLFDAPLSPLCAPAVAARLTQPTDLGRETLLRSYRADEWTRWFAAAGMPARVIRGFVFDSSLAMAEAAVQGAGVALLPVRMFERELRQERLIQPFAIERDAGRLLAHPPQIAHRDRGRCAPFASGCLAIRTLLATPPYRRLHRSAPGRMVMGVVVAAAG